MVHKRCSLLLLVCLVTSLSNSRSCAAFIIPTSNQNHASRPTTKILVASRPLQSSASTATTAASTASERTDDRLDQIKTLELSNVSIHVGNIDWSIACDKVIYYFQDITKDLRVEHIDIKQATSKKRDRGKQHGGSAKVTFASLEDSKLAMNRFENESAKDSTVIGRINIRWALLDKDERQNSVSEQRVHAPVLSEERIVHRKVRAEKYARQRRVVAHKTDEIIKSLNTFIPKGSEMLEVPMLDWNSDVPDAIDPMKGGGIRKGTERGIRKQAQVEAFLHVLKTALLCEDISSLDNINISKVADLGSGAGNLSLPLAWFLREFKCMRVLAVDINARALDRLSDRAKEINIEIDTLAEDLSNLSNLDDCDEDPLKACSAVVSLHACGAASDLAIEAAVSRNLPFVVSPCCIGKGKVVRNPYNMPSMSSQRSGAPESITYPRSHDLQDLVKDMDYSLILSAADYSSGNLNLNAGATEKEVEHQHRGRLAKTIVETDRLKWAEEHGYFVRMMEIPRLGSWYPKRELLLGARSGTSAASRISQLSTTQLRAKNIDEDENGLDDDIGNSLLPQDETKSLGMDLGGFIGYLAPYAFALFLSIGVTAAFFKFVLLDY
eukprot:scaffold187_cov266-Chaetoceros_neogracile.AAC.13